MNWRHSATVLIVKWDKSKLGGENMESKDHIILVEKLYDKIKYEYLNGDDGCIFYDSPNCSKYNRSPLLPGGARPDIYVETLPNNKSGKELIIGEAKTVYDISTEHSIRQYKAFFNWCKSFKGNARIVFAVPLCCAPTMRNVVKNKLGYNYNDIAINIDVYEF